MKKTGLPMKANKTKISGIKPLKAVKMGDDLNVTRPLLKLNKPAPMLGVLRK